MPKDLRSPLAFLVIAAAVMGMVLAAAASESNPSGDFPSVKTEHGTLELHGAIQVWWQQEQKDPARGVVGTEQFQTRCMELGFYGQPADRVEYDVILNFDGDSLELYVQEAWIGLSLSKSWSVQAGTFYPPWTLEMPDPIHDLRFIRYPLMVENGGFFIPWAQTGVMANGDFEDTFSISAGVFNGLADDTFVLDNFQDVMVSARAEVYPGLAIHAGHFRGQTELAAAVGNENDLNYSSTWLAFELDRAPWYVAAEALWQSSDLAGSRYLNANGWQTSLGYSVGPFQGLVRYETFDPDTSDTGTGADDEMDWTTLGLNYEPVPWCRLMGNYIFKAERQQNQWANDEILIQVSVAY